MEIHHDKHHATYIANLNAAVSQVPDFYFALKQKLANGQTVADLLKNLSSVPESIRSATRNHGGGHYNHTLFWQMMKKDGGGEPKGELGDAIQKHFGGFGAFKDAFTKAALGQFGSGWAWLTLKTGALEIESGPNQDNPISSDNEVLLGLDLWEHAYYLKYQNRRADYIAAWFNVINWDFVAERYEKFKR
jgi:Fe-Mn family superoxide dismutase